jgi:NAD(P)-dependent dehydrogenase (short-subunit alcohol dehydrogenase family)
MIGLMNVLHLEGQKNNIRTNILSPTAATRMTDQFLPEDDKSLLVPEAVTPGLLYLVSDEAPSGIMLCAGAGCFARAELLETQGLYLPESERTPEAIAGRFDEISSRIGQGPLADAWSQTKKYVTKARSMTSP